MLTFTPKLRSSGIERTLPGYRASVFCLTGTPGSLFEQIASLHN
jgi:hypothetical protein